MAGTFAFYTDSSLTTLQSSSLISNFAEDGSTGSLDFTLYLGSTAVGKKIQNLVDPGTTSITITPTDSSVGTGAPATSIKVATSAPGLNTAVAGAAASLPTTIYSGIAQAVPIYIRIDPIPYTNTIGTYNDLSLVLSTTVESAA